MLNEGEAPKSILGPVKIKGHIPPGRVVKA